MSSFRDQMRQVADSLLALQGPFNGQGFDICVNKLTIYKRVWDNGRRGNGTPVDTVWADIPQQYLMKHVTVQEIQNSGGRYEQGDIKVGPITPAYNTGKQSGGWSELMLHPTATDNGVEFIFALVGEHTGNYRLQAAQTLQAFNSYLILRRDITCPAINLAANSTIT